MSALEFGEKEPGSCGDVVVVAWPDAALEEVEALFGGWKGEEDEEERPPRLITLRPAYEPLVTLEAGWDFCDVTKRRRKSS